MAVRDRYTHDYACDNSVPTEGVQRFVSPTGFESLLLDVGSPDLHGLVRLCYTRHFAGLLSSATRVLAASLFEPLSLDAKVLAAQ